jgi:hypothetical protein
VITSEDDLEPRRRGFLRLRPVSLDLGDVFVQVFAVALGVVVGFAVTSWSEHRHEQALLRETVENIVAEIRANQTGLREVMAEHAKQVSTLNAAVAQSQNSRTLSFSDARKVLNSSTHFSENIPLGIAWQIAQTDQGLTLLPYQDRYDLAWIYELQTFYIQAETRYESSLLNLTEPASGNYFLEAVNMSNQLGSVVATEKRLDDEYTKALAKAQKEFP